MTYCYIALHKIVWPHSSDNEIKALDVITNASIRIGRQATWPLMISFAYVVLFVVVGAAVPIGCHSQEHGWPWPEACLALFCSINLLVCIWELGLFLNRDLILKEFLAFKRKVPKGSLPQPIFMFEHVPLAQALTLEHWSKVWSTYSLMDPSYSDQTSYGCVEGHWWLDKEFAAVAPDLYCSA